MGIDEEKAGTGQVTSERFERMQGTLEEILQQLKQQNRAAYHHDFSYLRLLGSVAQLLVVALVFWTVVGLVDLGDIAAGEGTNLKILGAALLQLMALTFFFLERQER